MLHLVRRGGKGGAEELAIFSDGFLCPRHKMAEGHIESYLSLCVCLCVPESCPGHNFVMHGGI